MKSGPQRFALHRPFDLLTAVIGLAVSSPVLVAAWAAAGYSSKGTGLFRQTRIGQAGKPFEILKFRTMTATSSGTTVTTAGDSRITGVGRVLRNSKIDEIPQLVNVLRGEMSLIGPRPDVAGFADELIGEDRSILSIRPGITGPSSLLFSNEESLLASVDDPDTFNSEVLFPLKTAINRAWVDHGTLIDDLRILIWTVKPPTPGELEARIHHWDPELSLAPVQTEVGQ